MSLDFNFSVKPALLFFPNPAQQWYFDRLTLLPALGCILAIAAAVAWRRHNIVPLFVVCMFSATFVFFTSFFSRYFRPRYLINAQFWYILILAFGIYLIWLVLKSLLPLRMALIGAMSLLLAVSINLHQVILPSIYQQGGFMPISEEFHYDMNGVDEYVLANMEPKDALISTIYANHVNFNGFPEYQSVRSFRSYSIYKIDRLTSFMKDYPNGWLVIDQLWYEETEYPIPREKIQLDDIQLEYMTEIDDQYIWRWKTNSNSGS